MAAIANRYARALADVSFKLGQHEAVERELEQFGQLLDGNRELSAFYEDPAVSASRKKAATSQLLARLGFCKTAGNFIHVLVERNRMRYFNEMLQAFRQGIRDRLGIVEVGVTTSTEIGQALREQLSRTMEQVSGKRVELRFRIDPQILGGVITRVGDTIYDGSVRQQLQQMKERLSTQG
jgi:F-type H+-transporting ATPase subunit delta